MQRLLLLVTAVSAVTQQPSLLGRNYWETSARRELDEALRTSWNTRTARNVIIFIGDGMGPNTVTAARIYGSGETGHLVWERFPHVGALKTYATDKQVTDSAAAATAMFTGVKGNYDVLGLSGDVRLNDCPASLREEYRPLSIASQAQLAGKSVGIVTTARVTHATPAGLYAHSAHRDWECRVPEESAGQCKDIGRQLIEDLPGRDFNVIMGGGQAQLQHNISHTWDNVDMSCIRYDGLDLMKAWSDDKSARGLRGRVVEDRDSLLAVDPDATDYLLGIFAVSHMPFDHDRDSTKTPSLEEMTIKAVNILNKNTNGFLLMVEAEHVDLGHHRGRARKSLSEVISLNETVTSVLRLLETAGISEETLVIVTSDHSHTLTISGYPTRGNDILGVGDTSKEDGLPYTTLSYANGVVENYHYRSVNGSVVRDDPSRVNTSSWDYGHLVAVPNDKNTHGGHDVFVWASGPYAHLFHHMHENNYVASVVRYAARLGEYNSTGLSAAPRGFTSPPVLASLLLAFALLR